MNNTLSDDIEAAGINPELDNACKRLLAEKIILAWIMKSCIAEYKDIPVNDIAEKYIEGTPEIGESGVLPEQTNRKIGGLSNDDASITEGAVRYDIRFYALAPKGDELIKLIINVEAQNKYSNSYPLIKRAIYYLSRMISAQHGTEFEHSHYESIKKVYSIWVCTRPPEERADTIFEYSFAEHMLFGSADPKICEKVENYDLMTAIIICMGKKINTEDRDVLTLLKVLLSNLLPAKDKKTILTERFDIPMSNKFDSEVEKMCNISAGVIEDARNAGIEIGEMRGEKRGIEIGVEKGRSDTILLMLNALMTNTSMPFEQAVKTLNVPTSEWSKYKKLLDGGE